MINLGDYLGQLLAEITIARAQADLEAVRIAELYANHEYLKHFPVPRVRIRDIDLDIPIIILETEDSPSDESPRGGVSPNVMRERFDSILDQQLKLYSIDISANDRKEINRNLDSAIEQLNRPKFVQADTNLAADKFTLGIRSVLIKRDFAPNVLKVFLESTQKAARTDFINARSPPPRVLVGTTNAQIREAHPDSIVRMSFKISEEGMEWTIISADEDGDRDIRLVPE